MTSKYSSSIRNDQIVLHVKPQKQMKKVLLFRKEKNGKQALKQDPEHITHPLHFPLTLSNLAGLYPT